MKRLDLSLLKVGDQQDLFKFSEKQLPTWKKELLKQLNDYANSPFNGAHWKEMADNFSVKDILAIVGPSYTFSSWTNRIYAVLKERSQAVKTANVNIAFIVLDSYMPLDWTPEDSSYVDQFGAPE